MTAPPPSGGDRTDRPHPRDNGLAAEHFVPLVDVDPRIAVPLLEALRRAGIAAYVAPTPGVVGGYLDVRLPERPTDRLWVDGARRAQAGDVVRHEVASQREERPAPPGPAEPAAPPAPAPDPFDEIVAAFHEQFAPGADPPWPAAEDLPSSDPSAALPPSRVVRFSSPPTPAPDLPQHVEAYLDEHFVPEPPPPLPRPAIQTFWALVGVLGGLAVLVGASVVHWELDPLIGAVAAFGILGGFATLIWRMRERPDDSGDDDGAVV